MSLQKPRLTKRQKRLLRQEKVLDKQGNINPQSSFSLKKIVPMTDSQKDAFESYEEGYNLVMTGVAGTGKTYLAMQAAVKALKEGETDRIVMTRPAVGVEGEQHGFRQAKNIEDALDTELTFYSRVFGIEDVPGAIDIKIDNM